MVTKEEIAQNEQFLLLSPCFQFYSIIVFSTKWSFKKKIGYVFKVVGCRVIACGERVKLYIKYTVLKNANYIIPCWNKIETTDTTLDSKLCIEVLKI